MVELWFWERLKLKLQEKLRGWLGVEGVEAELVSLRDENRMLWKQLNEFLPHLELNADVHTRSGSWIVVVGEFRNHDYVSAFRVEQSTFFELVNFLNRRYPRSKRGRMDVHPSFSALVSDWKDRKL